MGVENLVVKREVRYGRWVGFGGVNFRYSIWYILDVVEWMNVIFLVMFLMFSKI